MMRGIFILGAVIYIGLTASLANAQPLSATNVCHYGNKNYTEGAVIYMGPDDGKKQAYNCQPAIDNGKVVRMYWKKSEQ